LGTLAVAAGGMAGPRPVCPWATAAGPGDEEPIPIGEPDDDEGYGGGDDDDEDDDEDYDDDGA